MKALLVANTSWYLANFRLPLAHALQARGWDVLLVSPADSYSAGFDLQGLRWKAIPILPGGMNPLVEFRAVWSLIRLYLRERPQVVHHFTVKCILYGTVAAKLAGVPHIINAVTGLGYVFSRRDRRAAFLRSVLRWIYRPILRDTRVVFQNGDDLREYVRCRWVTAAESLVIPGSGVDIERFLPSGEPDGIVTVLLPARMLWAKGIREFVDAARFLKSQSVSARFVMVGPADPENPGGIPLDSLKDWQAEGTVQWRGWEHDMPSAYQDSHIVCLPSYYGEGLPRVLTEAAASGRPIITTDTPGCRDVVRNGENGLLVPARDVEALANAMRTLILDRDMRRKMGTAGRSIAAKEYALPVVLEQTWTHLYESTHPRAGNTRQEK